MLFRLGRRKQNHNQPAVPASETGIVILSETSLSFPLEGGGGDDEYANDKHEYLVTVSTTVFREAGREHTTHRFAIMCGCCLQKLVRGPFVTTHGLLVVADWARTHGIRDCSHQPGNYPGGPAYKATAEPDEPAEATETHSASPPNQG